MIPCPYALSVNQPIRALALALAVLLFVTVRAGVAAEVEANQRSLDLNAHAERLEDTQGQWDLADVMAHPGWQTSHVDFNQGYTRSAWWLRFSLTNTEQRPLARYLEVASPLLDHLDVYLVREGNVIRTFHLGDAQPYTQRPIDHHNFVMPLTLPPDTRLDVYLRVQSSSSVQAPLTLWDRDAFASQSASRVLVSGLFYGSLLLIAAYNLLLAFGFSDRTYLYYVGYVLSMALLLASVDGLTFRFLWPEATYWNDQSIAMSLAILPAFAGLFARNLLGFYDFSRLLDRIAVGHVGLSLAIACAVFLVPYETAIKLGMLASLSGIVIGVTVGPLAWFYRQPAAKPYTLALSVLFLAAVGLAVGRTGLVESQWLSNHSLSIGLIAEVLILSMALGQRINRERQGRFAAQRQALAAEEKARKELEARVATRTQELAQLNARLKTISQTDELTGLSNRRNLEKALRSEFRRCQRNGQPLTLAVIDIDHFKAVNDNWGHRIGDLCLQAVAGLIDAAAQATPSGLAARYGGEEFCLLLPEVEAAAGYTIVETLCRDIAREPIAADEETLSLTVSVGVTTATPTTIDKPEDLLRHADRAMYRAKAGGRNRVHQDPVPSTPAPTTTRE